MNHPFPITSRKLLAAIGSGPGATRWTEFFHKYTPGLRDYATRHVPSLEADDLIQDTFLILVKRLKTYQYDPKAKGAFHNYLTGILRFLAIDRLRDKDRETASRKSLAEDPTVQSHADSPFSIDGWKKSAYEIVLRRFLAIDRLLDKNRETASRKRLADDPTAQSSTEAPFSIDVWKKSAYEIALRRFLADPRVQPQTKEIFKRVAIRGEKPETVAADFGLTRNAVDQIKDRSIRRFKVLVAELEKKPR